MTSAIFVLCFAIFVATAFDPRNGVIVRDDPTYLIITLDGVGVAAVFLDCRVADLTYPSAEVCNRVMCLTRVILSETDDPNHFILQKNGQDLLSVVTGSGKCLIKVASDRVTIRRSDIR